jgi:hypothetical protein
MVLLVDMSGAILSTVDEITRPVDNGEVNWVVLSEPVGKPDINEEAIVDPVLTTSCVAADDDVSKVEEEPVTGVEMVGIGKVDEIRLFPDGPVGTGTGGVSAEHRGTALAFDVKDTKSRLNDKAHGGSDKLTMETKGGEGRKRPPQCSGPYTVSK